MSEPDLPGLAPLPESETLEVNGAEFLALCDRVKREGRYIAVVRVERPGVYRCEIRTLTPGTGPA